MSEKGRAPDGWTPDNSLSGKTSDAPCPPCTLCGQPMYYMYELLGVFTMHLSTGNYLCSEQKLGLPRQKKSRNKVEED